MKKIYLLAGMGLLAALLPAQTPADLFFVPKGNVCAGVTYAYNSWDKYWEGDFLRSNGNVGTVRRQQFLAGFNLGVVDRVNLIVQAAYGMSSSSQGTLNGQSDLQDLLLNLKGNFADLRLGKGQLRLGGNFGFSTPLTGYLVDFSPLNIGAGTTNLSYRQLVNYQLDNGFYACGKANYTYRSNISSIHRDFYFDQNNAYYTNEVHVPNLFDWSAGLGFTNGRVLAEVDFNNSNTLGGSDIRTWDPGFPANNVDQSTLTGRFDYYLNPAGGLSFSAMGGYTLSGRNAGRSAFGSISVYYQFRVWGKSGPMK